MESDNEKKKRKPHPVSKANIISQGTFAWTLPLFMTGFKRELEEDDLFQPLDMHRSNKLGDEMEKMWFEEVEASKKAKREPSLLKIIIKATWKKLALTAFFIFLIDVVIKIVQPLMLQGLIRYFAEGNEMSVEDAYTYAGGILICSLIPVFALHPYMLCIQHLGMRLRIAMCSMLYRKALRLSRTALGQTTIGQIVNLMSNDVNRFDVTFMLIHNIWIGPVQTVIISYLAYQLVGPAAFIGLGFLLIFIPFQGWLGKKTSVLRLKTAVRTDERVRLMNEIITGIQVIKMYAWEKPFNTLVSFARRKEVRQIRRSGYIKAVMYSFILFHARTSVFLTIFSYALFGNFIRAEMVFVIQSYYAALRMSMSMFLPTVITQISEALVSVKRIKTFLMYDETNIPLALKGPGELNGKKSGDLEREKKTKDLEMTNVVNVKGEESFIHVKCISAKWNAEGEEDFLKNVTFDVNQGELTVIIGPVGSGKSSLLYTFLNELPLNKGSIEISGSISYASQEPWLFPGTVRQNILFGEPFDRIRYRQVVMMCALLHGFRPVPLRR
uniref:Multidrug resistance-associated protein 4 n=2 Tax=Lygus hesperus TaxID=30085 RepID=A0A0A9VYF9_LYGHE